MAASRRWVGICRFDQLLSERPVAVLLGGRQLAVVRLADGSVHAVDNLDPFSGAQVLARGLVGTRGDVPILVSPMYKQAFDLRSGRCLDDVAVALAVYDVRVISGEVEVGLAVDVERASA